MHRLAAVICFLTLILTGAGCKTTDAPSDTLSSPSPVLDRVFKSGILRVGMSGDQPPFNMTTHRGQIIGVEPDLANGFADAIGVRAEFIKKPFADLLKAVESHEVDLVLSQVTMTPARNTRVAFVGPYFISGKAILTRSKALAEADEAKDINMTGIRISALAGSTSEDFIQKAIPAARLYATANTDEAVQAVLDGKVDAMMADRPVCIVAVLRHPDANLVTLSSPFTFEPIGAALAANDPLFLNLVENYVNLVTGTGMMEELEAKWFDNPSWLKELN